jgi:hypothetical protein
MFPGDDAPDGEQHGVDHQHGQNRSPHDVEVSEVPSSRRQGAESEIGAPPIALDIGRGVEGDEDERGADQRGAEKHGGDEGCSPPQQQPNKDRRDDAAEEGDGERVLQIRPSRRLART